MAVLEVTTCLLSTGRSPALSQAPRDLLREMKAQPASGLGSFVETGHRHRIGKGQGSGMQGGDLEWDPLPLPMA